MADLPEPISREDHYLSNIAGEETELPEPVSREDFFLANIAGMNVPIPEETPNEPRVDKYLRYIAENGGGGDISLITLTATENTVYTPPSGKAYSEVTVNVPQSGGVGINIAYDGTTTTGRDTIDFMGAMTFYKACGFINAENFVGAEVTRGLETDTITAQSVVPVAEGFTIITFSAEIGGSFVIAKAGIYDLSSMGGGSITVPSDGVYIELNNNDPIKATITKDGTPSNVPQEVYTAVEMGYYKETAQTAGLAYLYLGETDATYTNGDIYVIEEGT